MSNAAKSTLLRHISELRNRLIKCLIAVLITSVISFVFAEHIFHVLILPTKEINLIYIEMTEMLGTYMKVSLAGGIILAAPFLTYQFLAFVLPALSPKEKKYILLVLPWATLMFIGGVAFSYFVLIPPAANFLTTFGSEIATPQIKIGNYVAVVTRLLLAVGFVFEIPLVTTFLARMGVISPKWLADKRKVAIIFAFILAAIITPTIDPINQSLIAVPIIALYEMSIWLAKLAHRRRVQTATS